MSTGKLDISEASTASAEGSDSQPPSPTDTGNPSDSFKNSPDLPHEESTFQKAKRWLRHHKIEMLAVIVVIVGIAYISVTVSNRNQAAESDPQKKPPIDDTDGTHDDGPTSSPQEESGQDPQDWLNSPIVTELSLVTDSALLYDETTPQYLAAKWVVKYDLLQLSETSPNLRQRYALATLYLSTGGALLENDAWSTCGAVPPESTNTSVSGVLCVVRDGKVVCGDEDTFDTCEYKDRFGESQTGRRFLSSSHECDWAFVTCDENMEPQGLNIENNGLEGTLPPELGLLTGLTRINLSDNKIRGHIPNELGLLEDLRELLLSRNQVEGSIPSSLYDLWRIRILNLDSNGLTGSLSDSIENWESLRLLFLDNNQLQGQIPLTIGELTRLERISLHNNELSGPIPSVLGQLYELVSLELNNNYLTGSVDESVCSLDIGTIKADCLPDDGDVAVMCRCCTTCCFESSCKEMSGEA